MKPNAWLLGTSLAAALALPAFASQSHFVILGGLGGEPLYDERFAEQVDTLAKVARKTAGDDSLVHALSGKAATRAAIEALFQKLRQQTQPPDSLALILIGHGTYDGHDYKFNVPGPDLTDAALKALLDALPAERQLVVNTTSASGAMLESLQSERRIVITATKNGRERNATIFARFWVEALDHDEADTDKNGVISALEAYRYADQKVKTFYETEKRLATEHSRLVGDLAGSFTLARLAVVEDLAADPAVRELLRQREALERQVEALKLRKSSLPEEEYFAQLEALLLELAGLQTRIDQSAAPGSASPRQPPPSSEPR